MRRVLVFGAFVAMLLPMMSESALAQKAARNGAAQGNSRVATDLEYGALRSYPQVVGRLQNIDSATGTVSFTIEHTHPVLQKKTNTGTVSRSRRPSSGVTVKIEKEEISFELRVQAKAPLRKQTLSLEYDDRGEVKQFTAEEKAKLKGKDSSLPGYAASMDEMKPGSLVKLSLNPAKSVSQKQAKEDPLSARPTVKMVLLMPDPDMPTQKAPAAPAKKKN